MILVTVGTQLPFDRLVHAVDAWAAVSRAEVFAQIGPTKHPPQHIPHAASMSPEEFKQRLAAASLIVAHAGMGTIITAINARKRLVVVPRRADLGEHRNDHQLATVAALSRDGKVHAAADEHDLIRFLDNPSLVPVPAALAPFAEPRLLDAVRGFVSSGRLPPPPTIGV